MSETYMKRYLVLSDYAYGDGGMKSFVGDFDSYEDALSAAKEARDPRYQWAQIYDCKERKIVSEE